MKKRITTALAAASTMAALVAAGAASGAAGPSLGVKCAAANWGSASGTLVCALVSKGRYAYVQVTPIVAAPDKTTVTTAATSAVSKTSKTSRKNPGPLGAPQVLKNADNGDIDVLLDRYVSDATAQMSAANQFNDRAPAGQRYVLVHLMATYHAGTKADNTTLFFAVAFSVFGSSGVERKRSDCSAVPPEGFDDFREVVDGGTLSGNLCFLLPSVDATGPLALRAAESICFSNCDQVWFKLQ